MATEENIQDIIGDIEEAVHRASQWVDEVLDEEGRASPISEIEISRLEVDAERLCQLGATLQNFGECASLALQQTQAKHDAKTDEEQAAVLKSVVAGFETLIAETNRTSEEIAKAQAQITEPTNNIEPLHTEKTETFFTWHRGCTIVACACTCANCQQANAKRYAKALHNTEQNDASKISDGKAQVAVQRPIHRPCLQNARYCSPFGHSAACIEWRKALDEAAERHRVEAIQRVEKNDASKISDGKDFFGD